MPITRSVRRWMHSTKRWRSRPTCPATNETELPQHHPSPRPLRSARQGLRGSPTRTKPSFCPNWRVTTASPSWVGSAPTPTAGKSSRSATRAEAVSSFTSRTTDRSPGERVTPPCGPTPTHPSNTWYHLAATYQPGTHAARIYLNGVLAGSATMLGSFEPALYAEQTIPLGSLDLSGGMPPGVSVAVRSQSAFVASSGGTVRFRVNSGTSGDIYRVWMGNLCLFSAGNAFGGPDHTQNYDNPSFAFSANGWRTSGAPANGDDDLIEITFAPGQPTTYKITPGASNDDGTGNSNYNSYDPASGLYANALTNRISPEQPIKPAHPPSRDDEHRDHLRRGRFSQQRRRQFRNPGPSFTP